MHATQIVAYSFRAELYAPSAILDALPTGEGETYDGWAHPESVKPRTLEAIEESLRELALSFGIDRDDEHSFDSDDFPKVVFASQIDDWSEETLIDSEGMHATFEDYYA